MCGAAGGDLDFGDGQLLSGAALFLAQLDGAGNRVWSQGFGAATAPSRAIGWPRTGRATCSSPAPTRAPSTSAAGRSPTPTGPPEDGLRRQAHQRGRPRLQPGRGHQRRLHRQRRRRGRRGERLRRGRVRHRRLLRRRRADVGRRRRRLRDPARARPARWAGSSGSATSPRRRASASRWAATACPSSWAAYLGHANFGTGPLPNVTANGGAFVARLAP